MVKFMLRFVVFVFIVSLVSCASEGEKDADKKSDEIPIDTLNDGHIKKVTKIFYNVPSPIEMNSLIQRTGSHYNEDLLNPASNRQNYTTNSKMALNLGVYGADLSYARLYDQIQISIDYLTHIKKITQ